MSAGWTICLLAVGAPGVGCFVSSPNQDDAESGADEALSVDDDGFGDGEVGHDGYADDFSGEGGEGAECSGPADVELVIEPDDVVLFTYVSGVPECAPSTVQLTAWATGDDGGRTDVTTSCAWRSSNPSGGALWGPGSVAAGTGGVTTVTATHGCSDAATATVYTIVCVGP